MKRVRIDETTWPLDIPEGDADSLAWKLRNSTVARSELIAASDIIGAYHALISLTVKRRAVIVRGLRYALDVATDLTDEERRAGGIIVDMSKPGALTTAGKRADWKATT
jgi:hypothetical protein